MREVHRAHPDDPDVACLTAEALMQLRPWKLWTPAGTPAPEQPEIRQVLEDALVRWPDHPGPVTVDMDHVERLLPGDLAMEAPRKSGSRMFK